MEGRDVGRTGAGVFRGRLSYRVGAHILTNQPNSSYRGGMTPAVMPPLTVHFRRGWQGWWEVRTEQCGGKWVNCEVSTVVTDEAKVAEILREDFEGFRVVRVEDPEFDA